VKAFKGKGKGKGDWGKGHGFAAPRAQPQEAFGGEQQAQGFDPAAVFMQAMAAVNQAAVAQQAGQANPWAPLAQQWGQQLGQMMSQAQQNNAAAQPPAAPADSEKDASASPKEFE